MKKKSALPICYGTIKLRRPVWLGFSNSRIHLENHNSILADFKASNHLDVRSTDLDGCEATAKCNGYYLSEIWEDKVAGGLLPHTVSDDSPQHKCPASCAFIPTNFAHNLIYSYICYNSKTSLCVRIRSSSHISAQHMTRFTRCSSESCPLLISTRHVMFLSLALS